jgi:hypothetical protein
VVILDIAYDIYWHAKAEWPPEPWPEVIAAPFGRPPDMPPHRWVVSWDVMQALTEAAPPAHWSVNPKTAAGAEKLLFGFPLVVVRDAPSGTIRFEMVEP